MKINYKNTALGLLDNINVHSFTICEDAENSPLEYKRAVGLSVINEFPKVAHLFKERIQYISDPFYAAYNKSVSKLAGVLDSEPIDQSGTFISRSSPGETNTIFYSITSEGQKENFKLNAIIFFFSKEAKKDKPTLAIIVQKNAKGFKSFLSELAAKNGLDEMSVIADVFSLILFLKYCDLETKEVKGNSRATHIGTKYVNETKNNIQILDSTWFTTLVRSDGFHVRGHFRFQPCGQGMKDRKLIWISDYDKEGYTRQAKVLSQPTLTQP
jgi:hypothetical protein